MNISRGTIKKGAIQPLSKPEKQVLIPKDIVPLELRAINASGKQIEGLRYKKEPHNT
jgi:hypothetical protein